MDPLFKVNLKIKAELRNMATEINSMVFFRMPAKLCTTQGTICILSFLPPTLACGYRHNEPFHTCLSNNILSKFMATI